MTTTTAETIATIEITHDPTEYNWTTIHGNTQIIPTIKAGQLASLASQLASRHGEDLQPENDTDGTREWIISFADTSELENIIHDSGLTEAFPNIPEDHFCQIRILLTPLD